MKVELVSSSVGRGKYSKLNNEEILSAIARHGTIKNDGGKLVRYLLNNKHYSPLDMINFTFEIETSLSIGRQLLRHSSIKPQEFSGRYAEAIGFEPIELRQEDTVNRQSSTKVFDPTINLGRDLVGLPDSASNQIKEFLALTNKLYKTLLEAGVAKECARFILPNCTTTILSFNGSLRSWLAFLNVRCDHHAQLECQQIATLIGESLEKELPNVFGVIDWRKGMFM